MSRYFSNIVIRVSTLILGFLLVGLSACSSQEKKALKPAELVDFEHSIEVEKLWRVKAGSGQDKRYSRFVPAVDEDLVFASDTSGRVYAFDLETGEKRWKSDIEAPIGGSLSVSNGLVLLGTYDAELIVLNAQSGDVLWKAEVSSEIIAPPATNGSVVAAQTIDGRVFAFDAKTGALSWSYDHTVPVLTFRGTSSPVVTSTQVIAAFDNGQIVSLSASDGALGWSARVSRPKGRTELERIVDIEGTPIVESGFVYAAAYNGNVAAMTRGQGRVLWKADLSTFHNLSYASGKLFVTTEDSRVVAYNAANGAFLWENKEMLRRDLGAPTALAGYVAVLDSKGYMHTLDATTGEFAHRFRPLLDDQRLRAFGDKYVQARFHPRGDTFRSPMVGFGNKLLVLSDSGFLTLYDIQPGSDE